MTRKILLSRTDRIGDLILSTPAIASVRASFPDAAVTMVVSPYNRVVMERNPDVDELLVLPREVRPQTFGRMQTGYDLAIALAPRTVDLQLVGATRAKLRVGYTYERRWFARLTAPLYVDRLMISEADPELCEREPQRVVRHEVVQLLDLAALAGARTRVDRLALDVSEADRVVARTLPERPIVVHLGARWFRDGSTLPTALAIVQRLAAFGPVVVTCARECENVAPAFEATGKVDRLLRSLPFHQWAAVFERARVVVTVDTGATHVASAVRRPTVVAFEHRYFRLNSQEWAPYGVPHELVRKPANDDAASLAHFGDEIVDAVARLNVHA
ncbi:MAG TPA: glycosyltransferase family 9 protein [Candidatus Tumulicola sp.]|jgi:ADP-heptose:LPS heptosyltransferase